MGEKKRTTHYVDNRAFTDAVRAYQSNATPETLDYITTKFFIPLAEAVANNWSYYYSDHFDLTQEAITRGIETINHPNAARHAFNFFTKVFRNRMFDISRSDSNRSKKARKHEDEWNAGYHRPQDHTHDDTTALDAITDAILNGDGTTRDGRASIVKIAAETGLSRQEITSFLEAQKSRLAHMLRPSQRAAAPQPKPQPIRYAYTQTTLPLEVAHENHPVQKLRGKRVSRGTQAGNSVPGRNLSVSHAQPYRRRLRTSAGAGVWC